MSKYEIYVKEYGELPALSFPRFYPLYYVNHVNAVFCSECASKYADEIVDHDIHWEGTPITCNVCNTEIESVYGEIEEEQ